MIVKKKRTIYTSLLSIVFDIEYFGQLLNWEFPPKIAPHLHFTTIFSWGLTL